MELIRQVLFSALSLVVLLMEAEGTAAAGGRAVEEGAGGAALQEVAQGQSLLQEEPWQEWKEALRELEKSFMQEARRRLQGMEAKIQSLEGRVEARPSMASAPPPTADTAQRHALGEQLYWAASRGSLDDVRLLLDAGADPKYVREDSWTPLMGASLLTHASVASLLLRRGADVNATDRYGKSALHHAGWSDPSGRCVAALLAAGARVAARDNWGHTPLHVAANHNNEAAARALLAAGASKTLKDNSGKTPLEHASDNTLRRLLRP